MSHDDRSKAEATKKYQQIVVPDHALKPDTSGTSFLRTGTFPSLTDATKQPPGFQKSLELARQAGEHHLKTGGSWHHVDGNRIETTTGRKVEVIAGSYVAHRGPGNSPGPNFSATWATNSYTQVGSFDVPIGWDAGANPAKPLGDIPTEANDPAQNFAEILSFQYDGQLGTPQAASSLIETTSTLDNSTLSTGDVFSVTWAQRIMTYVGSVNRPVPLVYQETRAGKLHSYSYYGVESLTYVGASDSPVPTVYAETHASSIVTKNRAKNVVQDTTSVAITTTQEAVAAITVTNTAINLATLNVGNQEVVSLGPTIATVNVATGIAAINVAAAIAAINVGEQLVINIPEKLQFTLSDGHVVLASKEMDVVKDRVTAAENKIGIVVNRVVDIGNHISTMDTKISATDTRISELRAALAVQHILS